LKVTVIDGLRYFHSIGMNFALYIIIRNSAEECCSRVLLDWHNKNW